ncbi:MAG: RNA polymerase factor sigma-54, partial [Pseudomonadales bacterium]|nr:RNA polymerase factor sigma-54 [Pseudomonadales bacterium]
MKPTLQLKLGQSLTMTPQLQQAIRLLQLSTLDLQQEIQSILEANPMLEMPDEGSDDSDAASDSPAAEEHGAADMREPAAQAGDSALEAEGSPG